jgi:1,2-dihydroxy-3-keto-5-methylthiopentene dioxygenase
MTILAIFRESVAEPERIITHFSEIAELLADVGVRLERWKTDQPVELATPDDVVMDAYRDSVEQLKEQYDFQSVDIVSLRPDHPKKAELRHKFLEEHTHADFEVRFFVDGQGLFFLHPDHRVYAVLCDKGDLISVPADTPHWFDMGENPSFRCIRLFTTPEGWVAEFTGKAIAQRFPSFDEFLARYA